MSALNLVAKRYSFYQNSYYLLIIMNILIVIAIFFGYRYYSLLLESSNKPIYFATNAYGQILLDSDLDRPLVNNIVLDDNYISNWVGSAVPNILENDFHNYVKNLQKSRAYFTPDGYQLYIDALASSRDKLTFNSKKLISKVSVVDTPKVTNKLVIKGGSYNGRYAWRVKGTYNIIYMNGLNEISNFDYAIDIILVRESILQSSDGVLIARLILERLFDGEV